MTLLSLMWIHVEQSILKELRLDEIMMIKTPLLLFGLLFLAGCASTEKQGEIPWNDAAPHEYERSFPGAEAY